MIHLVGEDARSVPDWFKRRLRDIDTALVVYFNPFKNQFCIDRCIKGSDCLSSTHIECEKSNVHIFRHMGEAALDDLKAKDGWTKYGTLENQRRDRENQKAEYDAKQREAAREAYKEAGLDNKAQLHRALDLIKTHDCARVHK